jgi:hypothetical protein
VSVGPPHVYVSYSSSDEKLVEQLVRHIRLLERERGAELWFDRNPITAGEAREHELRQRLEDADVFLLLISADYLEKGFGVEVEMPRAIERARSGEASIIPVLLRDVSLRGTELAEFQLFPSDGRAIASRRDKTKVFDELADVLGAVIDRQADPSRPQVAKQAARPLAPERLDDLPEISSSVRGAIRELTGSVPAAAIVARLLALHPEYGADAARTLKIDQAPSPSNRPVGEWLARVRALYREDAVPLLDGRVVVRGLALLEPALTKQLLENGFLAALEGELEPPLDASLAPEGRRLWDPGDVPTLADRPAREDRLRRDHFARGLADMIQEERGASAAAQTGHPESFPPSRI